jgi:hypothetical protein
MYKSGIEIPKVDFSIISCNRIAAGSYFIGFNLGNSGKLSKMDCNGIITVIEGAGSSIYEEDSGVSSALRTGAGSVPSDYATVSGGQCNLITAPSGGATSWLVTQNPANPIDYSDAVTQDSTTGAGVGAAILIDIVAGTTSVNLTFNPGQGYQVGDLITILGSQVGGSDGVDDVILQVDSVFSGSSFIGSGCSNSIAGLGSSIVGGVGNTIDQGGYGSFIGGGNDNLVCAPYGTVAGGLNNVSTNVGSSIVGGAFNTTSETGSTVGGGVNNTSSGFFSTVGGGESNTASCCFSTVGGGGANTASGYYSTVSGGGSNTASNQYSTVSGGRQNTALCCYSTVSGGFCNTASSYSSTVGGGKCNTSSCDSSTVSGGFSNTASGYYSTVSGGCRNTASGSYSGILGGQGNNICGCNCSFIVGSNICADRTCTTFVNTLSVKNMPTESDLPLPSGVIYLCTGDGTLRIA